MQPYRDSRTIRLHYPYLVQQNGQQKTEHERNFGIKSTRAPPQPRSDGRTTRSDRGRHQRNRCRADRARTD